MRRNSSGGLEITGSVAGVWISPGLIVLARIRCLPPSATNCRVSAAQPALAALCAFCSTNSTPRIAAIEPTLMIDPPPRAIRCGQAARVT